MIALEEIQDNNGPTNDGDVDATATYNKLIDAIEAAGGPAYQFRQINPVDGQEAASRAATSGSDSCSGPTAGSPSSNARAAAR